MQNDRRGQKMAQIIDFARDELGITLYEGQAQVLADYYASGKNNWLLLSGRRGGKSLLSDVIACYEATVEDYSSYLRPNEDRYILIVSVRDENAKLHIRNIAKLLRLGKRTRELIDQIKEDQIILKNGVIILSLPASARAARGYTASTLILDEAAFFMDTFGNSSAEAIFTALSPTVATFGDKARVVITTSVNAKVGLVYELYDRALSGELDDWYITKTSSRELNPKVSERIIKNAMKRDPEAAGAEYYSEFREQTESYLSSDAIERCIDAGLASKVEPGKGYLMAIDPALMRDNYAYGIGHREDGLIVIDYVYRLTPPVDPNAAEDLLKGLNERYRPSGILCDNPSTVQRLKNELPMRYTPFTRQQKIRIYGSLKEAINLGMIALPNDPDLIAELKALQIRGGVDISAPKSGRITHDDLADVVALIVDGLQGNYGGQVMFLPSPYSADGWDAWKTDDEKPIEHSTYNTGQSYYPDLQTVHDREDAERKQRLLNNFWTTVKKSLED
jgi:hypothetical protein